MLPVEIVFNFFRTFEPLARGRLVGKFHGKARTFGSGFFHFRQKWVVFWVLRAATGAKLASQVSLLSAK